MTLNPNSSLPISLIYNVRGAVAITNTLTFRPMTQNVPIMPPKLLVHVESRLPKLQIEPPRVDFEQQIVIRATES